MHATTIGLDIAKSVFQVHGEDATGKILIQKKLRRGQVEEFSRKHPACLIGLEACARRTTGRERRVSWAMTYA